MSGARLRHLETMESVGPVGAFFVAHWSNVAAITGAAQALVPAGGVVAALTVVYAVECIGVGAASGVTGGTPGGAPFALYNAGGNTLTVTITGGGEASVAVSAGAATFNASLLLLWV